MSTYRTEDAGDGTLVTSTYIPQGWGAPLAFAVYEAFGRGEGAHFVADILKIDRIFPAEWHTLQRRERVNRLFESPVQVGDLVFTVESTPGRMYQKTRKLVARVGALTASTPTPQNGVSHVRAVVPRLNALALPDAAQPPRDDLSRIVESLATALGAVTARLEAVETEMLSNGMTLDGQKFQTSEERIMRVMRRVGLVVRNRKRADAALRRLLPEFTYEELCDDALGDKYPVEPLPTAEDDR